MIFFQPFQTIGVKAIADTAPHCIYSFVFVLLDCKKPSGQKFALPFARAEIVQVAHAYAQASAHLHTSAIVVWCLVESLAPCGQFTDPQS